MQWLKSRKWNLAMGGSLILLTAGIGFIKVTYPYGDKCMKYIMLSLIVLALIISVVKFISDFEILKDSDKKMQKMKSETDLKLSNDDFKFGRWL